MNLDTEALLRSQVSGQRDQLERCGDEIERLLAEVARLGTISPDLSPYLFDAIKRCTDESRDAMKQDLRAAAAEIEKLRGSLRDCVAYIKGDIGSRSQRDGILREADAILGPSN